jgi:acetyl esterase/lipase
LPLQDVDAFEWPNKARSLILGHIPRQVLGALAVPAALTFCLVIIALPVAAQSKFYGARAGEIAGMPGTLIRKEPMRGAPEGASAYRVLYRSTSFDGKPIAVSGVVIVPQGAPPTRGRPIVAWAHPTTGVVPRCAPSLAIFIFQQIQGLRELVDAGYVVTATDYPGLGTPGPHPYLVGGSEARAVLDSVRVARSMPGAGGGSRYAVWGHSQGGQATIFTGLLAKPYAPELDLVGVAAAAPATELETLMTDDLGSPGGKNLTAMTLWSWDKVFDAPMAKVIEPAAMPAVDKLIGECIESIYDIWVRRKTERPLNSSFLSGEDVADREPWKTLLAANTPGVLPPEIPVFLAQGAADQLVRPAVTQAYMSKLCFAGSRVRFVLLPGVGHGAAARDSASQAVAWIADRFAGNPAPSDCAQ